MITYMREYIGGDLIELTNLYFAQNVVYMVIFAISIIGLVCLRNKADKGYKLFFSFALSTMVLIIYNPVIRMMINKLSTSSDDPSDLVFARLWLACPIWLIVSYVITLYSEKIKQRSFQVITTLIAAAVLIVFGNTIGNLNMMIDTNNAYKINPAAIEIADEVLSLKKGDTTSLFIYMPDYGVDEKFVNGGSIFEGINQYTGLIDIHRYYYSEEEWNNSFLSDVSPEGDYHPEGYINYLLWGHQYWHFEFAAVIDDESINSKIDLQSYEYVGTAGGYRIYRLNDGIVAVE